LNWQTIHAYAEEAELWTTLAINIWILLSAAYFAVGRLISVTRPLAQQVTDAAIEGAYNLLMLLAFLGVGGQFVKFIDALIAGSNLVELSKDPQFIVLPLLLLISARLWLYVRAQLRNKPKP
jgi:hypothetical protein